MSLWNILGGIGSVGAGIELADDIRGVGETAASDMGELSTQLQGDTAFKGYGVTTGLGTSTVEADGTTTLGVGPEGQMFHGGLFNQAQGNSQMNNAAGYMNQLMGMAPANNATFGQAMAGTQTAMGMLPGGNPAYANAAGMYHAGSQGLSGAQGNALAASNQAMQNSMQDTAVREQEIYDRGMAMRQPGLDAQNAQHMAREAATGRRGLMGSQFGGTGEDAAMARAQAQAMNEASFQAMGQAQTEMMNQGQLAGQYGQLGQGYAGAQGNLAAGLGGLGQGQAGLMQGNAQIQGNLANQIGNLGAQNAQLGQSATQINSNIANMLGGLGGQQANFGLNQYQQSYTPMQMQMQMMGLGGQNADRAQTGQLTGANLASQLGLGGIQAQVNAETTAADLYAKLFGAGMDAVSGMDFGDPGGWI